MPTSTARPADCRVSEIGVKHSIFLCCGLALTPAPLSLSAATLTNVPVQGAMIMAMASCHADNRFFRLRRVQ